jgi:hypothetical protein
LDKNSYPRTIHQHKGSIKQSPRARPGPEMISELPLLILKQPQTRCLRRVCARPPAFSFHGRAFRQSMLVIWHTHSLRTQNPRNGRRSGAFDRKDPLPETPDNFTLDMKTEGIYKDAGRYIADSEALLCQRENATFAKRCCLLVIYSYCLLFKARVHTLILSKI